MCVYIYVCGTCGSLCGGVTYLLLATCNNRMIHHGRAAGPSTGCTRSNLAWCPPRWSLCQQSRVRVWFVAVFPLDSLTTPRAPQPASLRRFKAGVPQATAEPPGHRYGDPKCAGQAGRGGHARADAGREQRRGDHQAPHGEPSPAGDTALVAAAAATAACLTSCRLSLAHLRCTLLQLCGFFAASRDFGGTKSGGDRAKMFESPGTIYTPFYFLVPSTRAVRHAGSSAS